MKIINPNVEILEQLPGIEGIYKQIEKAGRTCYKSEDNITEDSAKKFVNRMINSGHNSVLEHGTVYLTFDVKYGIKFKFIEDEIENNNKIAICGFYKENKYSSVNIKIINNYQNVVRYFITTNYRVVFNHNLDDLKYITEPTEHHERRITMKFTTNLGVTREGNRHRVNSISEESTRFCNYDKDKFGKQITYLKAQWIKDEDVDIISKLERLDLLQEIIGDILSDYKHDTINYCTNPVKVYGAAIKFVEICYHLLIKLGWTPEKAREVLAIATKTDIVYTAFASDWNHFFNLRLFGETGTPHPNMEEVCEIAKHKLVDNDLWKLIYPNGDPDEHIVK